MKITCTRTISRTPCVLLHHSQRKHIKYHWRRSLARVIYCLEKTRPVSLGEVTFTSHSLLGENTSSITGGGHFRELFTAWRKQVQYHWGRSLSQVIHCLEETRPVVSLGEVTSTSYLLLEENTSSIIGRGHLHELFTAWRKHVQYHFGRSLARIVYCLEKTHSVSLEEVTCTSYILLGTGSQDLYKTFENPCRYSEANQHYKHHLLRRHTINEPENRGSEHDQGHTDLSLTTARVCHKS